MFKHLQSPILVTTLMLGFIANSLAHEEPGPMASDSVTANNSTEVGPSCPDLSVTNIKNKEALVKFLGALKAATSAKDTDAIAKMVIFPLRVYAAHNYVVRNAAELKRSFSTTFSDEVVKAISAQKPEEIFCRSGGAMIGNGEVWTGQEGDRVGIMSINSAEFVRGDVFTCKTKKHLVIIDKPSNSAAFRYRSWNFPQTTSQTPDMEVANGTEETQGTSPCTSTTYTFRSGKIEYVIDNNVTCVEREPPKGAIGNLSVLINGVEKAQYYCFEK
jgi:hypothetical protein